MNYIQEIFKQTFKIDNATSATILITLFVFISGILLNQIVIYVSRFNRRRNIRKIFVLNLKDLQKKSLKQAEQYKNSASQFTLTLRENFSFKKVDISQLLIMKEIGYIHSFNAYFTGLENLFRFRQIYRKAFNKMWDAITALEFWQSKSLDLEHFNSSYALFNEQRNQALLKIQNIVDINLTNSNLKHHDPFKALYYKKINEIYLNWNQMPNKSRADNIHRYLVLRLRILNRKYDGYSIPMIAEINFHLQEASLHYQNLTLLLKTYKDCYVSYYYVFRKYGLLIKRGLEIL